RRRVVARALQLAACLLQIRAQLVDRAEAEEALERAPFFALRLVDEVRDRPTAQQESFARRSVDRELVRRLRRARSAELAVRRDRDERLLLLRRAEVAHGVVAPF